MTIQELKQFETMFHEIVSENIGRLAFDFERLRPSYPNLTVEQVLFLCVRNMFKDYEED